MVLVTSKHALVCESQLIIQRGPSEFYTTGIRFALQRICAQVFHFAELASFPIHLMEFLECTLHKEQSRALI